MKNQTNSKGPKYRVRYTAEFKHEICRKYLGGNFTKQELQDEYGVRGKSRLLTWLRELGYIRKNSSDSMGKTKSRRIKVNPSTTPLNDAQLQAEIYLRMIEMAEREYKIKIRKNYNTK